MRAISGTLEDNWLILGRMISHQVGRIDLDQSRRGTPARHRGRRGVAAAPATSLHHGRERPSSGVAWSHRSVTAMTHCSPRRPWIGQPAGGISRSSGCGGCDGFVALGPAGRTGRPAAEDRSDFRGGGSGRHCWLALHCGWRSASSSLCSSESSRPGGSAGTWRTFRGRAARPRPGAGCGRRR